MKANYEKGVYRQLEETWAEIADRKAAMQEMKKQHEAEIAAIKAPGMKKSRR